ncbi:MAG: PAS domain-containing sensor histidine kinase [Candidatus Thorarchaeota archaeon]
MTKDEEASEEIGDFSPEDEVLKAMIDNSHDGIVIINSSYEIEYANREACRIFGGTKEDLVGHDFRPLVVDEDRDLVSKRFEIRRQGGSPPSVYKFRLKRKNQSPVTLEARVELAQDSQGNLKSIAHVLDVTQQETDKRALREAQRRNRILVETMNEGIIMNDDDDRIIFANDSFCDMLGYDREDIMGKKWMKFTQDQDKEMALRRAKKRRKGKKGRYEVTWLNSQGEEVPTIISATPYFGQNGDYVGSFAVVTDVSSLKEMEQTQRFYLDLLTHDIANQLQVIMTAAGLVDCDLPRYYVREARDDILESVELCNRLITKVKRISQLRDLPRHEVNLTDVIAYRTQVLKRVHCVEVITKGLDKEIQVLADDLLGDMLWNILENAVYHNPKPEKKIWIEVEVTDGSVEIAVADNGPGISDPRKEEILDTNKRRRGVGLMLVSQMIKKHGGSICIEDRVPGKVTEGAKFVLTLPLVES